MSYACLQADIKIARFISTGGQLNPLQPALIKSAIERLATGLPAGVAGDVVLALDNDNGGHQLAAKLTSIFQAVGRENLNLKTDMPPTPGDDWNDELIRLVTPAP